MIWKGWEIWKQEALEEDNRCIVCFESVRELGTMVFLLISSLIFATSQPAQNSDFRCPTRPLLHIAALDGWNECSKARYVRTSPRPEFSYLAPIFPSIDYLLCDPLRHAWRRPSTSQKANLTSYNFIAKPKFGFLPRGDLMLLTPPPDYYIWCPAPEAGSTCPEPRGIRTDTIYFRSHALTYYWLCCTVDYLHPWIQGFSMERCPHRCTTHLMVVLARNNMLYNR